MKKLIILVTIALALAGGILHAQEETPSPDSTESKKPPKGPLLKRAPKCSRWTITYTYAKGARADANNLIQLTVIKTSPVVHTVIFYQGGTKAEAWNDGENQLILPSGYKKYFFYNQNKELPTEDPLFLDYNASDFQGLGWISLKTFAGRKKDFLVFVEPNAKYVAYINDETRLPARVIMNGVTADYAIQEIPNEIQSLPPELKQTLEKTKREMQALTRYGSRPAPTTE